MHMTNLIVFFIYLDFFAFVFVLFFHCFTPMTITINRYHNFIVWVIEGMGIIYYLITVFFDLYSIKLIYCIKKNINIYCDGKVIDEMFFPGS